MAGKADWELQRVILIRVLQGFLEALDTPEVED